MPAFDTVLFDLDGTLIDSAEGIFNCIEHALTQYEIKYNRETFYKYLGPSLRSTFADFLPDKEIENAIKLYRERYTDKGIYECTIYEGVAELLQRLKASNYKIALATAKPEIFAKKALSYFGLEKYFDFIGGASLGHERDSKERVIEYVLSQKCIENCHPVMVGDRANDMQGALLCGIPAVGVLYGYAEEPELLMFKPLFIAKNTNQLGDWLVAKRKRDENEKEV